MPEPPVANFLGIARPRAYAVEVTQQITPVSLFLSPSLMKTGSAETNDESTSYVIITAFFQLQRVDSTLP